MVTYEQVRERFTYDAVTGELRWRICRDPRYVGKVVRGRSLGYIRTAICGKRYFVHKLIWLFHTGEYPACQIDHKNRNKLDNRIENLRKATDNQNKQNVGLISRNTSGAKGVSFDRSRGAFKATYTDRNGKQIFVGRFPCVETAIIARAFAVVGEHGEFAA